MYQGNIGADFHVGPGTLSVDAVGGWTKDAVSSALAGGANAFGVPNIFTPQGLSATISDNTSAMLVAKYTWDRLKLCQL
jgi:hypothetical protein